MFIVDSFIREMLALCFNPEISDENRKLQLVVKTEFHVSFFLFESIVTNIKY